MLRKPSLALELDRWGGRKAGQPIWLAHLLSLQPATSLLSLGSPGGSQQLQPSPLEGFVRSSSPTARPRRGLEEDGLLSGRIGGSGTWASSVLHWAPGGLSGTVPRGWAPVWPPQPTWAQVRKAGMSRTGTFLVSAFTRRFRSSVSSTTSRSSRIGSSLLVGMKSLALSLQ